MATVYGKVVGEGVGDMSVRVSAHAGGGLVGSKAMGWDVVDVDVSVPVTFAVRALAVGYGGPRYRVVSRLKAGQVSAVVAHKAMPRAEVWVTAEDRSELVVRV